MVLFKIAGKEIKKYYKDCRMWASYAKKAKGFVSYHTVKRHGFVGQYASMYSWKTKKDHDRFMKKLHDWLVSKSSAKVKVLGYYNLSSAK